MRSAASVSTLRCIAHPPGIIRRTLAHVNREGFGI